MSKGNPKRPGVYPFPRLRDLPEAHRGPFSIELENQTRPIVDEANIPWDQQDFYYPWDYERWVAGMPPMDWDKKSNPPQ